MILFQVLSNSIRFLFGLGINYAEKDFNPFLVFANGFVVTLTDLFISILIPFNIANKNRKSIELSSAGTTIATINLFYWFCDNYTRIILFDSYDFLDKLAGR